MKHFYTFLFLLVVCCITSVYGQHTNFNSQKNWSLNKKEFLIGVGGTNFLGDLGGRNQVGTDFSPADLDVQATSLGGILGFRFRFAPKWATTFSVSGGLVRGSDANTNEVVRNSRNLSFRSPVVTVSQRLEYLLSTYEQFGSRYKIPGIRGAKDMNNQLYVFAGIGATYFNPQGQLPSGEWRNLADLNTEGQGLEGGPKDYIPFTVAVPMGIGFRWGLDKVYRLGVEISYVYTFTDYLDDVSGTYYDQDAIATAYGPDAAYFSNPSTKNQHWFAADQQRGDSNRDSYVTANIILYRNLTYKPSGYKFGRPVKFKGGGRYKF